MEFKNKNQARLRLVKSDDLDLCNSCSFTAASPLGSEVRPVSISLTDDGSKPITPPISLRVIPVDRRSVMREAQVFIRPNVRHTVLQSQRLPVTEFRENSGMPKPPGMPDHRHSLGERISFWRGKRGLTQKQMAKAVGYSVGALSDLENNRSKRSEKLHLIAAKLRLNAHYLEDGNGEPEAEYPQDPPPEKEEWPFPAVPPAKIKKYGKVARAYIETQIIRAINDIEAEKREKSG